MKVKLIFFLLVVLYAGELFYISMAFDSMSDGTIYTLQTNAIVICLLSLSINIFMLIYMYVTALKPLHQICKYTNKLVAEEDKLPPLPNAPAPLVKDLKTINSMLKKAGEGEYQANKSKKELLASLDHDIKNPINSIREIAELLQMRIEPGKERMQIELICAKANHVQTLITDILSSVPESAQEVVVRMDCISSMDIYDMINDVDYDKKIVFVGAIPKCDLLFDSERLEQVFEGIISNSYKYAGTKITIHAELDDQLLHITLRDYGAGVDPVDLSKLFDKYYRGKNIEGRSGAGLGLYVAASYMEKMNGFISCENYSDGFGVTVSIRRDVLYGQGQLT